MGLASSSVLSFLHCSCTPSDARPQHSTNAFRRWTIWTHFAAGGSNRSRRREACAPSCSVEESALVHPENPHRKGVRTVAHERALQGRLRRPRVGQLLIWDKVLGLGTTDPLAGFSAVTSNLVVSFYFAKRGFENVARIIRR